LIVKKLGGKIWFDTEVGKGTSFFVRLPVTSTSRTEQEV
jgi:signal transduction histidine kinase